MSKKKSTEAAAPAETLAPAAVPPSAEVEEPAAGDAPPAARDEDAEHERARSESRQRYVDELPEMVRLTSTEELESRLGEVERDIESERNPEDRAVAELVIELIRAELARRAPKAKLIACEPFDARIGGGRRRIEPGPLPPGIHPEDLESLTKLGLIRVES